ncbi:MAG: 50S ribosomal protein L10 [Acidilobus sp.]
MSTLAQRRRLGRPEPPEYKKRIVAELVKLLDENRYVLFADLEGLPAKQLHFIRKELRGKAVIKVAKKNLVYLALESKGLDRKLLEPYLKHGVVLIMTNENPFLLAYQIDKLKMPAPAKPGAKATKDIVIPEGDTGLRPGPIVSVFGKLKIPYEVRKGTIYVKSDTVVAKAGDVISPELASLLQQLGIQPMEIGLTLVAAWDGKTVIPGDMLHLDIDRTKADLMDAEKEAAALALGVGYFELPEVTLALLGTAAVEAQALVRGTGLALDPDLASIALSQAASEAAVIISALGDKAKDLGIEVVQQPPQQAAQQQAKKAEEKKAEEEKKEEAGEVDISQGLSSLFGS